jgi:arsenite methyltransferase
MPTKTATEKEEQQIKAMVKDRYTQVITQPGSGCCGAPTQTVSSSTLANSPETIQAIGYSPDELKVIPEDAAANSFGCGNPLAFAGVLPEQVVLDIGSGAGIDCFIAAQKVGPRGRVIGVDMTPAMLDRARANARKANLSNVEFLQGEADALPAADHSVDWVISNCVINLAPDKHKVFREIARVLKPGGHISVSDIVVGNLPWWVKRSKLFYSSCVAGALHEQEYLGAIRAAGLGAVEITSRFRYDENALSGFCSPQAAALQVPALAGRGFLAKVESWMLPKVLQWFAKPIARRLAGEIVSIKVTAQKPDSAH